MQGVIIFPGKRNLVQKVLPELPYYFRLVAKESLLLQLQQGDDHAGNTLIVKSLSGGMARFIPAWAFFREVAVESCRQGF